MAAPTATPEQVRATLTRLVAEHGEGLAGLSRMIRRSNGYLARFLEGGSPAMLLPKDRLVLAKYFQIDERVLGAGDDDAVPPWAPPAKAAPRQKWKRRERPIWEGA